MPGTIISVNRASTGPTGGEPPSTGIDKRPVAGRVRVTAEGLDGDLVANRRVHGGADQALYAYARQDAAWWADELGRRLPPGRFGENVSTEGLDLTGAVIGERWAVGPVLLEVSAPRIPCAVFAGFWDVPDLVRRFTARGAPGTYLRVLREGEIGAGDRVTVVHRPAHGLTVGQTFRALTTEPELLSLLVDVPELPERIRAKAARRLAEAPTGHASRG